MFNINKFQPLMMLPQQQQMQRPQMGYAPAMPMSGQPQQQQQNPMSVAQTKDMADMFKGMKNYLIGDDPMMSQQGQQIWDNALNGNSSFGDATKAASQAGQMNAMGMTNPLNGMTGASGMSQANPMNGLTLDQLLRGQNPFANLTF